MTRVSAIILGAGLSKRMGDTNKLFLPFKKKSIVECVIENVVNSQVDDIILVVSELTKASLSSLVSDRVKMIENKEYKEGMTSSIKSGVLESDSDGYMICLGDQPQILTSTYDTIIRSFKLAYKENNQVISAPFFQEKRGNPVIFSSDYREEILSHDQPEGCKEIIQRNAKSIDVIRTDDPAILLDIDTMDDYQSLINGRG